MDCCHLRLRQGMAPCWDVGGAMSPVLSRAKGSFRDCLSKIPKWMWVYHTTHTYVIYVTCYSYVCFLFFMSQLL